MDVLLSTMWTWEHHLFRFRHKYFDTWGFLLVTINNKQNEQIIIIDLLHWKWQITVLLCVLFFHSCIAVVWQVFVFTSGACVVWLFSGCSIFITRKCSMQLISSVSISQVSFNLFSNRCSTTQIDLVWNQWLGVQNAAWISFETFADPWLGELVQLAKSRDRYVIYYVFAARRR